MCGRFSIDATWEELWSYYSLIPGVEAAHELAPRYNIAPSQPILIVGNDEAGIRKPTHVRWGLIPSWVKDPDSFTLLANARSETAAEKPSFRNAIRHRRVLIPANGFYEWKRFGKGKASQPYWVPSKSSKLISFGGLMETWSGPDGTEIDTGCILTTASNPTFSQIHHRLPLVIQPSDFDRWLNCKDYQPKDVHDLLRPAADDFFDAIPVSSAVNKVSNNGADIQKRVEPASLENQRDESQQLSMFDE